MIEKNIIISKSKEFLFTLAQTILFIVFMSVAIVLIFEQGHVIIGLIFVCMMLYCIPAVRKKVSRSSFQEVKAKSRYKKEIDAALEDGILNDDEYNELILKAQDLGIDTAFLNEHRNKDFAKRIKPIIKRIENNRRYSPDDEKELLQLAEQLQIKAEFDHTFKVFRNLWLYENEGLIPLNVIDAPILLKNKEECYYEASSTWSQLRKVTQHKGYLGSNVGFKVAKGVRFSVGRAIPIRSTHEEMQEIATGEIYITNKRIVFNGDKKSTNVTYARLIQLELFKDGIEIRKTSGKPDFFKMNSIDAEYVCAIVHSIMN